MRMILAAALLTVSAAYAESAVDVIMATGTAQAFTDEAVPAGDRPAAPPAGAGAKASLGDSPAAIIIYKDGASGSPDASFDCGLAAQNMVIAASAKGYGVKIVSSPARTLNGENHDALCEKLGVDPSMQAVAVLLIGKPDTGVDGASGATTRDPYETKTSIIE